MKAFDIETDVQKDFSQNSILAREIDQKMRKSKNLVD